MLLLQYHWYINEDYWDNNITTGVRGQVRVIGRDSRFSKGIENGSLQSQEFAEKISKKKLPTHNTIYNKERSLGFGKTAVDFFRDVKI